MNPYSAPHNPAIVVGFSVGTTADSKSLIFLRMEYKLHSLNREPEDVPNQALTFVMVPEQYARLLQDLTAPLADIIQEDE